LVKAGLKGFVVPRFRLLPTADHVKCTQGCCALVGCALTMGHGSAQSNSAFFSTTDLHRSAMEGD